MNKEVKHRFIEVAEELGDKLSKLRGKYGRDYIRNHHGEFGILLDELDAAYQRWVTNEPGGKL